MSTRPIASKRRRPDRNRRSPRVLRHEPLENRELLATYMLFDDWAGGLADAEQSPENTDDDQMCWAAAGSNVLEWTGWGRVSGLHNTDQIFQYAQDHWHDAPGQAINLWRWWFDGERDFVDDSGSLLPSSGIEVRGGADFFPSHDFSDYHHAEYDSAETMDAVRDFLHAGYGTILVLADVDSDNSHAVTVWGYATDDATGDFVGVYVSDSVDDHVAGTAPNTVRYQEIRYDTSESRWIENDGTDYIARVEALERMPPNSLIGILSSRTAWTDSDRILRLDETGSTTMLAGSGFASWDAVDVKIRADGSFLVLTHSEAALDSERILRIDHMGAVTTMAASGFGSWDAVDMEIDQDGSVLLLTHNSATMDGDRILRVDDAGTVTMIAGSGFGSWDAVDMEIDQDGSILLLTNSSAMMDGNRILRIDDAGSATTVASSGLGSWGAVDMEVDRNGSYVLLAHGSGMAGTDRILRVEPAGTATVVATSGFGTWGAVDIEMDEDRGILVLARNPSMVDSDRILRVDCAGTVTTVAGSGFTSWDAVDFELFPPDSDGDGLLDDWERNGLDVNLDGTIDLDLPALGADPLHKDLFVEVDAMTEDLDGDGDLDPGEDIADGAFQSWLEDTDGDGDFDPGEDVPNGSLDRMAPWGIDAVTGTPFNNLDAVAVAFADAPVENPDGSHGINLHILSDEDDIPVAPFPNGLNDFDLVKADRFGTPAERSDANWSDIRAAKELVYRYCIFAGTHSNGTSSGLGEVFGNDFIVTLWGWFVPGGTVEQQQGTFMHELGHTLGLRHGGHDGINHKPNYHSIMSYTWQYPHTAFAASWELDYSRTKVAALDESNLDENRGVGFLAGRGHDTHLVPIQYDPSTGAYTLVQEVGPADFSGGDLDGDGVFDNDTGVNADINLWDYDKSGVIDAADSTPGEILVGHEDWSNLYYRLWGYGNFDDGAARDDSELHDDLTYESFLAYERLLARVPPGEVHGFKWHDLDRDGVWDKHEPGLEQWRIYVDANQNGRWDPGEISDVTDADGAYHLRGIPPGYYEVAEEMQAGWRQTFPGGDGTHEVMVLPGEVVSDVNFGNARYLEFEATPDDKDRVVVFPDMTSGTWKVQINATVHDIGSDPIEVRLDGLGGEDDQLILVGTSAEEEVRLGPEGIVFFADGNEVIARNFERAVVHARGGTDTAVFYETAAKAEFTNAPPSAALEGDDFAYVANDCELVYAYGKLQAAHGEGPGAAELTSGQLAEMVDEAIRRWEARGLSAEEERLLRTLTFQITDLPPGLLTLVSQPTTMQVDADAAGYGWFVDPTPSDDEDFGRRAGGSELEATAIDAVKRMDLLTVVMHELGHSLGRFDISAGASAHDLMNPELTPGIRRLPPGASPRWRDSVGAVNESQYFYLDTTQNGRWDRVAGGDTFRDFGIHSIRETATPVIGDWNGDGSDDLGLYNGGYFYLDANGNGRWDRVAGGDTFRDFGINPLREKATPVVGDWDGDGSDDLGLYNDGYFYLDTSGNGRWDRVAGSDTFSDFGINPIRETATPVIGDWDGNGTDDLGLYNDGYFYLDTSGNGRWDRVAGGDTFCRFGIRSLRETATPVVGDWDGNGADELGLYDDGYFYLDTSGNGRWDRVSGGDTFHDFVINSIRETATPIIGHWADSSPLLAAGGLAVPSAGTEELTLDALAPIVEQALVVWAVSGVDQAGLQRLDNVQVRIADLPGARLGEAWGTTITLDVDAAGYGWFVDATPSASEEFDRQVSQGLLADASGPAAERMDLLTVVMHELGHVLGFEDHDDDVSSNDVMNGQLSVGVRRMLDEVDRVFANGDWKADWSIR